MDTLFSNEGDDSIRGEDDADSITGSTGLDTIVGGRGGDMLTGGADADQFVFELASDSYTKVSGGVDTITDFELGTDLLILKGLGLTSFDTDGGLTEKGELRLSYDSLNDITHVRSDQTAFDIALIGNYLGMLTNQDVMF